MEKILFFIVNRLEFDSIWWKHSDLAPIGKPRIAYCQFFSLSVFFSGRNNADYIP